MCSAFSSVSFLALAKIMNLHGLSAFKTWRWRILSMSAMELGEYCIFSTMIWMLARSFERWISIVWSEHMFNFFLTSSNTSSGMVAETTWKQTCDGRSHQRRPSSAYSGWNCFSHWLMQCPSLNDTLKSLEVNLLLSHRPLNRLSERIFSGLTTMTR